MERRHRGRGRGRRGVTDVFARKEGGGVGEGRGNARDHVEMDFEHVSDH